MGGETNFSAERSRR